jgi:primase-polymerase (primpol)-like protein
VTAPITAAIPAELRAIPNWVCWRRETDDKGEPTKVLYIPGTNHHAKSTDPSTWTGFENTPT